MAQLSESALRGKKSIKEFQKMFNPHIEEYLERMQQKIHGEFDIDITKRAFDVFVDYSTRECKRLRASFTYYVNKMFNGEKEKPAIQAGTIIEIEHAALLVADDFMDKSRFRRGGPAAHREFQKYFIDNGFYGNDEKHFGDSISASLSLIGAYLGEHLLAEMDTDPKTKFRFSENLNRNLIVTGLGQITDIVNSHKPNVTEDNVMKMLKWKTGVYTYQNPIQTGAILAGASDEEVNMLEGYAIPGGISFQIQDDILGMFGDAKVMGKSAMDDLTEGKYTLLIHKALENGDEKQQKIIRQNLGNPDATTQDHEDVKKVIEDTGSLEYSRKKALKLTTEAKDFLTKNKDDNWNEEGYNYLLDIATYVIERDM